MASCLDLQIGHEFSPLEKDLNPIRKPWVPGNFQAADVNVSLG